MKIGALLILIGVFLLVVGFAVPLQIIGTNNSTSVTGTWELTGTISQSTSTVSSGGSITLTIQVGSYHASGDAGGTNLLWDVGGNNVHSQYVTSTGTWSYTYSPSAGSYSWSAKYVSYFESSPITTHYSAFGSASFSVSASAPVISTFSGSPNPSNVGQSVTFSSTINWNGNVGTTTYSINGISISNPYTFNTAGSYVVTLTAVNSIGSASDTYTQVVQSGVSKPSIESLTSTPNPVDTGTLVQFGSVINWNGNTGTVVYEINGNAISGSSYTFSNAGNYTITVVATNSAGSTTASLTEVVITPTSSVSTPVISSFSGSPNPVLTGGMVTLTTDINWEGDVGTVVYQLNGNNITGDTIEFTNSGNYTVKAIATNSAGSSSATIIITVELSTTTSEMQNIGQFAMSYNGTSPFYISSSNTYKLTPVVYPYPITIYYVENNGITSNLSQIDITMNSVNYIIPFTNITSVMGHTAYKITIQLTAGTYTIAGFLTPSNIQINGGNPIQITSFTVSTEQTAIVPLITETNYIVMGLGGVLVLFGIVFMVRKI